MKGAVTSNFVAILLGLTVVVGCGRADSNQTGGAAVPPTRVETDPALFTIGRPVDLEPFSAPAIRATTVRGDPFDLHALRGRVVIVNFWATYCAPCVKEMPLLVEAYTQKRDSGLVVVGVSMDTADNPEIRPFLDRFDVEYPVVVGGEFAEAFGGVYVLPTTFFVDRSGQVVSRINGLIREPVLSDVLAHML